MARLTYLNEDIDSVSYVRVEAPELVAREAGLLENERRRRETIIPYLRITLVQAKTGPNKHNDD